MKQLFIIFVLMLSMLNANIDDAKKAYYAKDFNKALVMFEQLSKEGNVEANYYLGTMYGFPYGVKQDYKKSFEYYTISSKLPNKKRLKSILNIALFYSGGRGVKQNNEKAFNLFKILDKENIGEAQYMMGLMYSEGKGVEQNYDEAIKYVIKGCNNKVPRACYDAGYSYEHSDEKNRYSIAKKYYKKACDAGIQESCEAIKKMQEPKSFLEKFLEKAWFSLSLFLFSLFMLWKYRKKKN